MQKQKKKKSITAVGQLIRAAGTAGGSALGGYFGMPQLGGAAGNQLAALASKWLGFGAYRVSQNSILKSSLGVPSMHSTNQTVIVRHKEYVGPITSSNTFNVLYELPLNPAMDGSFPWLSGVASRYQEYAFKGVVFHYVPSSGAAISGTSPSLGTVMIQTAYRASESAPTSKLEMLNEYCASEAVPSEPFIHPIECDPKENPFNIHYCRSMTPPDNEPLMSYDLGRTFVAVQGQLASGNMLGDLWVTYEVELKKPVVRGELTQGGYELVTCDTPTTSNLFASPLVTAGQLNVDLLPSNTIKIHADTRGPILIHIDFTSSSFSTFNWTGVAAITNGDLKPITAAGGTYSVTTVLSGAAQATMTFVVAKVNPLVESVITLSGVTWTGTATTACVSMYALDAHF
jgi:hypothetical protein